MLKSLLFTLLSSMFIVHGANEAIEASYPLPGSNSNFTKNLVLSTKYWQRDDVKKYNEDFDKIPPLPKSKYDVLPQETFNKNLHNSMYVNMAASAFCDGEDGIKDWKFLITSNIFDCVGLSIYNPTTQRSALSHITKNTNLDSLDKFLFYLGDSEDSKKTKESNELVLFTAHPTGLLKKVIQKLKQKEFKISYLDTNRYTFMQLDNNGSKVIVNPNEWNKNLSSLKNKELTEVHDFLENKGMAAVKSVVMDTTTGKLVFWNADNKSSFSTSNFKRQ